VLAQLLRLEHLELSTVPERELPSFLGCVEAQRHTVALAGPCLTEHAPRPIADPRKDMLADEKRRVVVRQVLAKAIRRSFPVRREIEVGGTFRALRGDLR
jgi:hypothetical protein